MSCTPCLEALPTAASAKYQECCCHSMLLFAHAYRANIRGETGPEVNQCPLDMGLLFGCFQA
eukprot:scaffold5051_cov19-Tisochrysis_lutea.AAC.5